MSKTVNLSPKYKNISSIVTEKMKKNFNPVQN